MMASSVAAARAAPVAPSVNAFPPRIAPAAGTYSAVTVTLTDTTPAMGVVIYYTTDGTTPSSASSVYSAPFPVAMSETVKAIAVAPGYNSSAVSTAVYTIATATATPTFFPPPGAYTTAQSVTLKDAASGAVIHYALNGPTPTPASPTYGGTTPIPVATTTTIKAIAVAPQHARSLVASATYTIETNGTRAIDAVTWHYDNLRTGVTAFEHILTPLNVNVGTFGKVGEFAVDGQIDGQVLYLHQVNMPAVGLKNVVYVATEKNTVYALDADSITGSTATVLWSKSLVPIGESPATDSSCGDIAPNGVTATPVIDRSRNAIYVVAMTMNTGTVTQQYHRLHALSLTTGAELFGGPTTVAGSVPVPGGNGTITFDATVQHDRAALLESGGNIYTLWSGQYGDCGAYSGWIIAYDAHTLAPTGAMVVTPDATGGGIWMGAAGASTDATGAVYLATGNAFNLASPPPPNDYPASVVRLNAALPLSVGDYFTPNNFLNLDNGDLDLGSAGVLVLPDLADNGNVVHHLAVVAGKDGNLFVLNRDNLGQFHASQNNVVQEFHVSGTENFSTPLYFNDRVYVTPTNNTVMAFAVSNALLSTKPVAQSAIALPGAVPSISSYGAGNGIVWAVERTGPALYAFNAANLSLLYASGSRDSFARVTGHFVTPTVANGRVFFGTGSTVAAFGLLPH